MTENTLSQQDYNKLVTGKPVKRVVPGFVDSRRVWIKHYELNDSNWGQWLHSKFSRIFSNPMFYASLPMSPEELLQHETKKIETFRSNGFVVPDVMYRSRSTLVLSDMGDNLEIELNRKPIDDGAQYDELLCKWAGEVGKLHAAGLCHGRPHPRDVTYHDGQWGFLDFEENPEAVMPLEYAQARDFFLLFHQVVKLMENKEILGESLAMYKQHAPDEVFAVARKTIRDMNWVIWLVRILVKLNKRKDTERFLLAAEFLKQNLE